MNIQVSVTTDGSWGYLGGHDTVPTLLSCKGSSLLLRSFHLNWNQKMLWCYSRISKETRLTMKCRVGAMLAAYVYFISFWKAAELEAPCEGREGRRWNVPGAAGTCLRHRNARKTQHAALAAVCIHSPSRCRQLLMLLSKFNVTFFSLLLFLSGLLFSLLYFFFFFLATFLQPLAYIITVRLPETGIPTGKSILSKQPHICTFSCFLIMAKPSFTKESFFPVLFP